MDVRKRVDTILEKIERLGEKTGHKSKRIVTKQIMIIMGCLVIALFGVIYFVRGTAAGIKK